MEVHTVHKYGSTLPGGKCHDQCLDARVSLTEDIRGCAWHSIGNETNAKSSLSLNICTGLHTAFAMAI